MNILKYFKRFMCKHYYVLIPFSRSRSGVYCYHCKKTLGVVINDPTKDENRPK